MRQSLTDSLVFLLLLLPQNAGEEARLAAAHLAADCVFGSVRRTSKELTGACPTKLSGTLAATRFGLK